MILFFLCVDIGKEKVDIEKEKVDIEKVRSAFHLFLFLPPRKVRCFTETMKTQKKICLFMHNKKAAFII